MTGKEFAFFLPTRKGSERILNKNTRTFAGIEGGLLYLKISQLLKTDNDYKIFISTNDPLTISIASAFADERILIIPRPDNLCQSSTNLEDLINYVPTIIDYEHIIWVHTTSPFVDDDIYTFAIKQYKKEVIIKGVYDSIFSVNKIQTYLWSPKENTFSNFNREDIKWPRTQDLEPVYEVNSAFFINSRDNYIKHNDRIGKKPMLFELNKLQSFDIDWKEDFQIAEHIYSLKNINSVQ